MLSLSLIIAFVVFTSASSHSEALGTVNRPHTDLTDLYMFKTSRNTVAFVMNINGFQQSQGGPNYSPLDNNFVYQIHVDNDGDAVEDVTFQFLTGHRIANNGNGITVNVNGFKAPVPLGHVGPITFNQTTGKTENINIEEYYKLRVMEGDDYSKPLDNGPWATWTKPGGVESNEFIKAYDNAGEKTFPGDAYNTYVREAATYTNVRLPQCGAQASVFVGPRRESFSIALGEVFDLINLVPATELPYTPRGDENSLDRFGITSFVLEVPQNCLLPATQSQRILGAWASVRTLVHRSKNGHSHGKNEKHYADSQTNRLGNPLFNELLIGLTSKNEWNLRYPSGDSVYLPMVRHPAIPAIIQSLFSSDGVKAPTNVRNDIVGALLTGVPALGNKPVNLRAPKAAQIFADMLRLNLKSNWTACEAQNSLSLFGGDLTGFPNGRRLGDDVVDIALRVLMGGLCQPPFDALVGACTTADAPSGGLHYTDQSPISACDFQCFADTSKRDVFPFLNPPIPGNKEFRTVFVNGAAPVISQNAARSNQC